MVKRLAKILMWIGISFVTIILLIYLAIRIFFPTEKLKQILISQLESTFNRQVAIDQLWLNPFKGLKLEGIVFYNHAPKDSSAGDTSMFFSADEIHLNYRFLSLLKREIEINDILIDHPEVNLIQDQNGKWNFDDLITTFMAETTAVSPDTGAIEFTLPLSVKLKKFSLNNLTTHFFINQGDTVYTIRTGGISMLVDDLFVPRKSLAELKQKATVDLKVVSDQQPWEVTLKTIVPPEINTVSTQLQLNIAVHIAGQKKIESNGEIALTNLSLKHSKNDLAHQQYKFHLPRFVYLSFALASDAEQGALSLDHLTARLGNETIFELKGDVTDFLNQPVIDLAIVKSKINLQNMISLITPLLPDSIQEQRQNVSINGLASLQGTTIKGNPLSEKVDDALDVNLRFAVDDFYASYSDPPMKLTNLKLKIGASEIHNINGVQKADISLNLSLDSVAVAIDTSKYGFGGLNLNLKSALNSDFMPDSVSAALVMNQFFDVPLNFNFIFKSIDRFNKYRATGNLSFHQLPLKKLPALMMDGAADFVLALKSESLDQIDLNLQLATDDIELQTETGPLTIKPLNISGNAVLATDTAFQKIDLKQLMMQANDFASARMHGDFVMGKQQQLKLIVDNVEIDHKRAMKILPPQWLEGYESLKISGTTEVTSQISVIITEDLETIIKADGKADIHAGILYPDAFLTLERVDGLLNFHSNGESVTMDLQAVLDSLIIEGVRDEPLRNMSLWAIGSFPDLETFKIDSSHLVVPDLMADVFMTVRIDSLSGNTKTNVKGHSSLDTEGNDIPLMNMLTVSGKMTPQVEIDVLGDLADITGKLTIDNLKVKYENQAELDSIAGEIYFAEKFDIVKETLIQKSSHQSFIADAGSYYYDLLRPYYQQSHDKFSHVRIGQIKAMDYFATDVNFDLLILNERIEIPRFSLKAYDGNMSGLLYANLHEGKSDQIEWKVKANVSRLNSAKLIPSRRVKEEGSELNLNLELNGTGIDPESQFDVRGYFYVTKIGPRFTDNALRSLDPKGTDKSIQDTRKLLDWGYKPRLISFEVKHGYLYPSIHLVKGKLLTKLIPLNLSGGKIEYARIPIKLFLSNLMVETK